MELKVDLNVSIFPQSIQNDALTNSRKHDNHHHASTESSNGVGSGLRRSLTKKASKLSFALKSSKESERSAHVVDNLPNHLPEKVPAKEKEKDSASQKSGPINMTATMSSGSSSFFDVSSNAHTITPETVNQQQDSQRLHTIDTSRPSIGSGSLPPASPSTPTSPAKSKNLPPIPRDFAYSASPRSPSPLHNVVASDPPTGEVGQEVFDSIGSNNLSVRFEITIVKVS